MAVRVSCVVCNVLANKVKPCNDRKLLKNRFARVAHVAFSGKKNIIYKITCLSTLIFGRRIKGLRKHTLKATGTNFQWLIQAPTSGV
jgi:hypothetical protein